ncbi:MAG: ATP-binding protein, partial [Succinivibrio sp.]|nr:ATP-binding protein [Succinivibrio sp.]
GKTALSIAAAIEAIKKGYTVRYFRMMELNSILNAKVDDSFIRFRELLRRTDVLIIDDFGGCMLDDDVVAKFNEIVDARYNEGATILTTQLRMNNMKDVIKTKGPICDALCNRLFRKSDIEIRLTGSSWRGCPEEIRGGK